jgi:hypothetical protein
MIEHIRLPLFVVGAIGLLFSGKIVPFVEAASACITLKRPEPDLVHLLLGAAEE